MKAQRDAVDVATSLLRLEQAAPRIILKEGSVKKLYPKSESSEGDMSAF